MFQYYGVYTGRLHGLCIGCCDCWEEGSERNLKISLHPPPLVKTKEMSLVKPLDESRAGVGENDADAADAPITSTGTSLDGAAIAAAEEGNPKTAPVGSEGPDDERRHEEDEEGVESSSSRASLPTTSDGNAKCSNANGLAAVSGEKQRPAPVGAAARSDAAEGGGGDGGGEGQHRSRSQRAQQERSDRSGEASLSGYSAEVLAEIGANDIDPLPRPQRSGSSATASSLPGSYRVDGHNNIHRRLATLEREVINEYSNQYCSGNNSNNNTAPAGADNEANRQSPSPNPRPSDSDGVLIEATLVLEEGREEENGGGVEEATNDSMVRAEAKPLRRFRWCSALGLVLLSILAFLLVAVVLISYYLGGGNHDDNNSKRAESENERTPTNSTTPTLTEEEEALPILQRVRRRGVLRCGSQRAYEALFKWADNAANTTGSAALSDPNETFYNEFYPNYVSQSG